MEANLVLGAAQAVGIGALVVIVFSGLSCLGIVLIRKYVGVEKLRQYNDTAGNIFQVVGTFYAVLLGLIVVDAMSTMSEMRTTLDNEADAAANIFILSRGLPSETRIAVQDIAVKYVDAVIDEEWDAMRDKKMSTKAAGCIFNMWTTLIAFQPTDPNMQAIRQKCFEEMSDLGDNRRKRVISALHGVSPVLWTSLIVGAFLTVSFMYFFGVHSLRGHLLMTGIVAASISMNVYLVYLFGYPFSGAYRLQPEGFMADRAMFSLVKTGNLVETLQKTQGRFLDLRKLHEDVFRDAKAKP